MAYNVKGITVEIGADATQLTEALSGIEKQYAGLDRTAARLKKSMALKGLDTSSAEGYATAQQLVSDQIEKSRAKIAAYEKTLKNWDSQVAGWRNGMQEAAANVELYSQQIASCEKNLGNLGRKQNEANTALKQAQSVVNGTSSEIEQYEHQLQVAMTTQTTYRTRVQQAHQQLDIEKQKLDTLSSRMDKANTSFKNGEISAKQYKTTMDRLTKSYDQQSERVQAATRYYQAEKDMEFDIHQNKKNLVKTIEELNARRETEKAAVQRVQAVYDEYGREIQQTTEQLDNLNSALNGAQASFNRNKANLDNEKQSLAKVNAEYAIEKNNLKSLIGQQLELYANSSRSVQVLSAIEQGANAASTACGKLAENTRLLSMAGGASLVYAGKQVIDYEQAWIGVTKTVDGTPSQLNTLNESLKELARTTNSSYTDIAHYAELAGQMGVGVEEVAGFTKTITELADTTNIEGAQAAEVLAQFANIMRDKDERTVDYYSRLGSTIVDLGNNFATTENDIMEMSSRLATAGRAVGMSDQEVLALATSLSSVGIEAAAGGGSMSKLMTTIQKAVSTGSADLQLFADTAGMTAQQFKDAWSEDAGLAFMDLITGIGESEDVTQKLSELGIEEVRMSNGVRALAQSSDIFKDALGRSNKAWSENNAMSLEAQKRYESLGAQLNQCKESLNQAAASLGEVLVPYLKTGVDGVKNFADGLRNMSPEAQEATVKTIALATAISPMAKLASGFFGALSKGAGILKNTASGLKRVAGMASLAMQSTGDFNSFGEALEFVFGKTNLVAAGVTAATAAIGGFVYALNKAHQNAIELGRSLTPNAEKYEKMAEAADYYAQSGQNAWESAEKTRVSFQEQEATSQSLIDTITELGNKENLSAADKYLLADAVERLNALYPELNISIDEETGKLQGNTEELLKNAQAAEESARKRALASTITDERIAIENETNALMTQKDLILQLTKELQKAESDRAKYRGVDYAFDNGNVNPFAQEGDEEKYKQAIARVQYLQDQLEKAGADSKNLGTNLRDMQRQLLDDLSQMDPEGLSGFGEQLQGEFEKSKELAQQYGMEIPEALVNAMNDASTNSSLKKDFLADLMNFTSMVDEAGNYGGQIPMSFASGILANASSLSEASMYLNNLISFTDMLNEAGVSGAQLPQEFINGIANGSIDLQSGLQQVISGSIEGVDTSGATAKGEQAMSDMKAGVDKSTGELVEKAGKCVQDILSKFSSTDGSGAGTAFIGTVSSGVATGLNTMESDTDSTVTTMKGSLSDAQKKIDDTQAKLNSLRADAATPVVITVIEEKQNKEKKGGSLPINTKGFGTGVISQVSYAMTSVAASKARENFMTERSMLSTWPLNPSTQSKPEASELGVAMTSMSEQLECLNQISNTLNRVASNMHQVLTMDGRKVGQLTAKGVREANSRYELTQKLLVGVK